MPQAEKPEYKSAAGKRPRSRKRKDQLLDELQEQDTRLSEDQQLIDQLRTELEAADELVDEKLLSIESQLQELLAEPAEHYQPYDPEIDDGDPELSVTGSAPKHRHSIRVLSALALSAIVAAIVIVLASAGAENTVNSYSGLHVAKTSISLADLDQRGTRIGTDDTAHKLVVYGDMHSSQLRENYKYVLDPLLSKDGRDLQLIIRPIAGKHDPKSQWAARTALVAAAHDRLLQFIDAYLGNGRKLSAAAREAGLHGWRRAAKHGKSHTIAGNRKAAHHLSTGHAGVMVADGQVLPLSAVLPAVREALGL